jgi:dTDP-4-amino-4,6-dideoxygalactose transaminase
VYHLFPVLSDSRAALRRHLNARGIETLVHYPVPLPRQPAFAGERPAECPNADRACNDVVSLPLHPGMTMAMIDEVSAALRAFDAAA